MSDTDAPTTALEGRYYLCLDIKEYKTFAEAVGSNCFLNRDGQACSIKNAKIKKLKNVRRSITQSPYLMKSLIWREQLRLLELELRRIQHGFKQTKFPVQT